MPADPNAQQWEQQAASGTGIPFTVTKQQAIAESGEGANIGPSSAGAVGFWQFLPTTYNAYASQAGVPQNTMSNAADETQVYIVYMNSLLKQEGGNIFKALEAYNAGPGNLSAGAGYASGILSKAGVSQSATAGAAGATTAGIHIPGTGVTIPTSPGDFIGLAAQGLLKALGIPSIKDLLQRLALILFGALMIYVGIRILSEGNKGGGQRQQQGAGNNKEKEESEETDTKAAKESTPSTEALSPSEGAPAVAGGTSAAASEGTGVDASEALEAVAIA
jgi:Transglycosylase SLT domain